MQDPAVPIFRLVTPAAWVSTLSLLACAWVAFVFRHDDLAALLGLTGCASSAVAATFTIRCYAVHLERLIRAAGGLPSLERPRVLRGVE